MSTVLVLAGGTSDEREISLRSGGAVAAALEKAGHRVLQHDPAAGLAKEHLAGVDVVFPILHGAGGEDGSMQERLEALGASYVGSSPEASRLCFDKQQYKEFLQARGLSLPVGALVREGTIREHPLVRQPFVLKPSDGGSSVDTFIIRNPAEADWSGIVQALDKYDHMLLEELVEGREITVGVLGEEALPVIEIIPPADGEFDYENKYNGRTQELCPPQHVANNLQTAAQQLALLAHQLCSCRDFSRTDLIITPAGELRLLETNTIPGMTEQSLFPKAAATAGLSMEALVDRLVTMALDRRAD